MKRCVILGGGESGVGAALLAKYHNYSVFLSEYNQLSDKYKDELDDAGIQYEEGQHSMDVLMSADLVIKSPGIPQTSSAVQSVRKQNIPVYSEIEFASWYYNGDIIAITGTNGKTTTTLLVHHVLKQAGLQVGIGGNIGESFARQLIKNHPQYFVLEVSSFQLEDVEKFHPKVAVITNITPDHLDRYEYDMELYAEAKFAIQKNLTKEDLVIYGADQEIITKRIKALENKTAVPIRANQFKIPSVSISPAILEKITEQSVEESVHFSNLPLPGVHNALNSLVAIYTGLYLGLSKESIEDGFATFKGAPHRMQSLGEINGVEYIDDSKATNVEAAYFALQGMTKPIIWIAGGTDKGNDYEMLDPIVQDKVKAMICLTKDPDKLMDRYSKKIKTAVVLEDVVEAIKKAHKLAKKGDVVLLSPACASFDLFKNYIDRGLKFQQAVDTLR